MFQRRVSWVGRVFQVPKSASFFLGWASGGHLSRVWKVEQRERLRYFSPSLSAAGGISFVAPPSPKTAGLGFVFHWWFSLDLGSGYITAFSLCSTGLGMRVAFCYASLSLTMFSIVRACLYPISLVYLLVLLHWNNWARYYFDSYLCLYVLLSAHSFLSFLPHSPSHKLFYFFFQNREA